MPRIVSIWGPFLARKQAFKTLPKSMIFNTWPTHDFNDISKRSPQNALQHGSNLSSKIVLEIIPKFLGTCGANKGLLWHLSAPIPAPKNRHKIKQNFCSFRCPFWLGFGSRKRLPNRIKIHRKIHRENKPTMYWI